MDYSCRGEIDTITGLLTAPLYYDYNLVVEDVIKEKRIVLKSLADRNFQGRNINLDTEVNLLLSNF